MKIESHVCSLELLKKVEDISKYAPDLLEIYLMCEIKKNEIKRQVCSLELSKRLKELEIKQDSLFYWTLDGIASRLEALPILESNYSAFTVAELGEILPDIFCSFRENGHYKMAWNESEWNELLLGKFKSATLTEADARAQMLIYLLENKLMEIKCITN